MRSTVYNCASDIQMKAFLKAVTKLHREGSYYEISHKEGMKVTLLQETKPISLRSGK